MILCKIKMNLSVYNIVVLIKWIYYMMIYKKLTVIHMIFIYLWVKTIIYNLIKNLNNILIIKYLNKNIITIYNNTLI